MSITLLFGSFAGAYGNLRLGMQMLDGPHSKATFLLGWLSILYACALTLLLAGIIALGISLR